MKQYLNGGRDEGEKEREREEEEGDVEDGGEEVAVVLFGSSRMRLATFFFFYSCRSDNTVT